MSRAEPRSTPEKLSAVFPLLRELRDILDRVLPHRDDEPSADAQEREAEEIAERWVAQRRARQRKAAQANAPPRSPARRKTKP